MKPFSVLWLVAILAGGWLVLNPGGINIGPVNPDPPNSDAVTKAFDSYERLWRQLAGTAADRLEDGEMTTDSATRDFLSEGNRAARKVAFGEIAGREQELLGNGKWTVDGQVQVLRGYE
jgi:hypothetical protein